MLDCFEPSFGDEYDKRGEMLVYKSRLREDWQGGGWESATKPRRSAGVFPD